VLSVDDNTLRQKIPLFAFTGNNGITQVIFRSRTAATIADYFSDLLMLIGDGRQAEALCLP
jgi:hypothetical protein